MRIIRKHSQHRRDCKVDLECEGCGEVVTRGAYDDRNMWDNVVPNWKCEKCGESTNSLGEEVAVMPTKYKAHEVV